MIYIIEELDNLFKDNDAGVTDIIVKPFLDGFNYICYNEVPRTKRIKDGADMLNLPCIYNTKRLKGLAAAGHEQWVLTEKCYGCTFRPIKTNYFNFEITTTKADRGDLIIKIIGDFMTKLKLTVRSISIDITEEAFIN